jgi:hypothetical protein
MTSTTPTDLVSVHEIFRHRERMALRGKRSRHIAPDASRRARTGAQNIADEPGQMRTDRRICSPAAARPSRTDRPFSCGRATSPHSIHPRAGNHPAPIPICRYRAPYEYAERARTRAQIICSRTSSGRAVGLSTDRRLWRPSLTQR